MREKLYLTLKKVYGMMMSISFFAGFIPLIPFLFAIAVGGELGETIAVFLHKQYYPYVIALGSLAIVVGVVAMYIGKLEGLSVKKISSEKESSEKKE